MNWNGTLLLNSLVASGAATLLAVALGCLGAACLRGLGPRLQPLGLILTLTTLALPPFLVLNGWLALLGNAGSLRPWLPLNLYSLGGTIGVLALLLWPIPALAAWAPWQQLDAAHFEVDPALSGPRLFQWLLLPAAAPALRQAALVTFALALANFAVPALLQTKVLPAELWVQFNTNLDFADAATLALPLVVAPLLLLLWLRRHPIPWLTLTGAPGAREFRRHLGRPTWAGLTGAGVILALFSLGVPLSQVLLDPSTWTQLPGALVASRSVIAHSALLAAGTATLTVALGLALHRNPGLPFLWLLFLTPGVLLGLALVLLLNRPPLFFLSQSIAIVFLAWTLRYAALGGYGVRIARRSLDPDLIDAARLEGASRWQRFRHVLAPPMAPQLLVTWYVVYLLCLWDVETLVLIVPPGGETLALRVFNLLHYGHTGQVNALCVALLGLAAAPMVLLLGWRAVASYFTRRRTAANLSTSVPASATARALTLAATLVLAFTVLLLPTGCGRTPAASRRLASQFFSHVEIIGTRGTGAGQFNKPRSLAVDRADNLYVVDLTGRVQKFSPAGEFLLAWQMPQTDLGKPKGMGLDAEGRILVIEPHYSRVNHFSPSGQLLHQWGSHGTNTGQLAFPRAIATTTHGDLYLSEYGLRERVQRFSPDGRRLLAEFNGAGSAPGQFNRPEGLGLDAADRLYVADSCNHRIQILDPAQSTPTIYGRPGSGPGELSYPYDVRIDATGHQFVCEFGNSRIQVFDPSHRSVEILGGPGAQPGQFNNPWSIAFDSRGNLFVADANNHRVQKLVRRRGLLAGGKTGP